MAIKKLDHVNFITNDMPATLAFYTDIIGLVHGMRLVGMIEGMEYLYIEGQPDSVFHIVDANANLSDFKLSATRMPHDKGDVTTGVIDHICLSMDMADYEMMINKLDKHSLAYKTRCPTNLLMKQVWVLDPNGVKVELNFT